MEILVAGEPGDGPRPLAFYEQVEAELRKRWQSIEPAPTDVFLATPKINGIFGGVMPAAVKNFSALSHDLGCSTIYLEYLQIDPTLAEAWTPEEEVAPYRRGKLLVDALLCSANGPYACVECAGSSYDAVRLQNIVDDSLARNLAYHIWAPALEV